MSEDFPRMKDKAHKPSEEEMISYIGKQAEMAWMELRQFLNDHYDFSPEVIYYGAKYGWTKRYRKSGKTLCSFFPEKGGFTTLITLGKKEVEKLESIQDDLSPSIKQLFDNTQQLHDGRWLWIRISSSNEINDIKKLIQIKRKPKKVN
ncbi:MAG: DUF3788 domain-containing protein [Candidatus Hodarchaeales archaeon]